MTRQEKEKLVIELYKQGKTIREIAKGVHMSFSDIGDVIKREFGSHDLELSKDAQVLKLFAKGTKPIDIAIKFNIAVNEVQRLHREYRSLCQMNELDKLYKELGDGVEPFLQLYKIIKEQHLSPEEITNTVRYANDLPILELRYEKVREEVDGIEGQKQNLLSENEDLKNVITLSRTVIANLDHLYEQRANEVKSLDCRRKKLQDGLLDTMGSKEYRKIKEIARQQIETILSDKKALLEITLFAIIQALKLDPEKQIFISNMTNFGGNQSYYTEQHRKELLELAEQVYDELAHELVETTIKSAFNKAQPSNINVTC